MTSLIDKIEKLIKREKTTPELKKKDECTKSSNEILSELFSVFNADPPKIVEVTVKKSKKSKKKHKKEKKKRSRSSSSSSDSNDSDHKSKRRKKSKSKKRKDEIHSPPYYRSRTPIRITPVPDLVKLEPRVKTEVVKEKVKIKNEKPKEEKKRVSIKYEDNVQSNSVMDASLIPMPESPKELKLGSSDLRFKLHKKSESVSENDKSKGKIQIKNLKFSTVFEETVKKAEEEARRKAEKYEEGEYTDSSSSSIKDDVSNSNFPKTSDPGGILKKQAAEEAKVSEDEKSQPKKSKHMEISQKSSQRESSRSHKRSSSKSKRSRSRSGSRRYHRSNSKTYRRSRSRHRSSSRTRRRSRSGHRSIRHRSPRHRDRGRRSPTGVRLADSEKKRLLEVARRNAINMLKNGAVPAGAAALPPHTRNQVMAAIQSGGKSVDELTDFCKHLSKKEALGELSSVSSHDSDMSENEDTLAFHHPFLVKEKAPIVMNIRGGAPLPIKSAILPIANKEELRLQFPVSSGSQHREKATEWVPVSPKKDNMQVAKLNAKSVSTSKPALSPLPITDTPSQKAPPLALPAPPLALPALSPALPALSPALPALSPALQSPPVPAPAPELIPAPSTTPPPYMKGFTAGSQLSSVPALPAIAAPGPQAYPPGLDPPKIDLASIVSQKIAMIRKEQEQTELTTTLGLGWSQDCKLGQFTGSTGANILTPRELASGTQAWAKKDQLVRAAPVEGGMGMHLLQKMGWTPGQGLGKEGTGTLQPLLLEVKLDTKGLQAKEEVSGRHGRAQVKTQRMGRRGPAPLVAGGKHPVSLLGEYCSKQKLGPPEYNLCFECGPDHKKNFLFKVAKVLSGNWAPQNITCIECGPDHKKDFLFKVKVAGVEYQPAVASANKKQAKADAASLALQKLGIVIT